mgnify:CR=1 FL=1
METETKKAEIEFVKDSFSDYLGNKERISASDIKNFLRSPRYYQFKRFEEERKEEERYFAVGRAVHEAILEPQEFHNNYIVSPKFDRRTTQGKKDAEEFASNSMGKTIISEDEMVLVTKITEKAHQHQTLMELLKDSYRELSVYTQDEKTGLLLKLRPDAISTNKSTITDLKTCNDSSARSFKRDVYNHGYSVSASFYMDFIGRDNYIFAALDKEAPHQVSLYYLNDEMIAYGREQYRMALDLIKFCKDNNYYPDYSEFEILKEAYKLDSLDTFFDTLSKSDKIILLQ